MAVSSNVYITSDRTVLARPCFIVVKTCAGETQLGAVRRTGQVEAVKQGVHRVYYCIVISVLIYTKSGDGCIRGADARTQTVGIGVHLL